MDDTIRPGVLDDYAATIDAEVDEYVDDWYQAMRREYGLEQPHRSGSFPVNYAAGADDPMSLIRRMPPEQARAAAAGILAMLAWHPDLRRTYRPEDLAYLESIAGPVRYAAHDVSGEPRDESGKWTSEGEPAKPKSWTKDSAAEHIHGLYAKALDDDFDHAKNAAAVHDLGSMKHADLRAAAEQAGVFHEDAKTKGQLLARIQRHIEERRAFYRRMNSVNADESL